MEAELRRVGMLGPGSRWQPTDTLPADSAQELSWIQSVVRSAGSKASSNMPEALIDFDFMSSKR